MQVYRGLDIGTAKIKEEEKDNKLEGALILEDDIVLRPGFQEDFEKTLEEYRRNYASQPILISYEDSSLQFIPRSRRVKGQWLYEAPQNRVRFNGALFISQEAAKAIWDDVTTNKCDIAVDHYYMHLYGRGLVRFLWCEPCLATQVQWHLHLLHGADTLDGRPPLETEIRLQTPRLLVQIAIRGCA